MAVNVLKQNPNFHNLPVEYQEVEYIESTGTQWIDTGVYPHQIGKWELDVQYTDSSPANQTNGCFPAANQRFDIGTTSNSKWTLNIGALNTYTNTDNERHSFVLDKINNKVSIDTTDYSVTAATFTTQTTYALLIGARNYYGSSSKYNCNEKIYSSKIYDISEVLIRNYVPCYRKADNVVGLYDTVNDVFYTNAGTGTFLKGNDVNNFEIQKVKVNLLKQNPNLPSQYQEVDYIESTGTQYIDTGIVPDENTNIDLKYQYTTTTLSSTGTRIFGCRGSGTADRAFMIALNNDYWYVNYYNTSNTLEGITWSTVDTNVHTIRNNGGEFYFDDVSVMTFAEGAFTSPYNALLMAGNANGNIYATNGRTYYCKIYSGTTSIRDFVPCYRKSDNEIGLYDLVNNVFYTNAGTGTFLKGNDVSGLTVQEYEIALLQQNPNAHNLPSGYQEVEYIESDGNQYINTAISCNQDSKVEVKFSSSATACGVLGSQSSGVGLTLNFAISDQVNTRWGSAALLAYGECLDNTTHIINFSKDGLYDNGSLVWQPTQNNFTADDMFVGKINGAVTSNQKKIYYHKIWNNNILVRNYIPCYRKSDNEIGLYDIVNDVFYTNAGTGTFLKGNNVNNFEVIKI